MQSTRPDSLFDKSSYEVWRRYKDFEWLRDTLEKLHFTLIAPVSRIYESCFVFCPFGHSYYLNYPIILINIFQCF